MFRRSKKKLNPAMYTCRPTCKEAPYSIIEEMTVYTCQGMRAIRPKKNTTIIVIDTRQYPRPFLSLISYTYERKWTNGVDISVVR